MKKPPGSYRCLGVSQCRVGSTSRASRRSLAARFRQSTGSMQHGLHVSFGSAAVDGPHGGLFSGAGIEEKSACKLALRTVLSPCVR